LVREVVASLGAEGWCQPAYQAAFVADRLEHHAGVLRRAAYAWRVETAAGGENEIPDAV